MPPSSMADKTTKSPSEEKALKEKLLDEKMKKIRQKNEERLRRQREIEEDIKNANTHDADIKSKDDVQSRTMAGVAKPESTSKFRGRARGRALEKLSKETLQAKKFKERQRTNYDLVEKEIKEEKSSTGYLFDDRRVDMSKSGSRSTHSWGGSQFEDVVDRVNSASKDQTRRTPKRNQNIEINMTGKERLKYQEWKEERQRVDQARQSRQKRGDTWKREWDWDKGQHSSSSFGGRHDSDDRTRSGQRFGQRTPRRKPDWDLHDDRDDDDFQQDSRSFSNSHDVNSGSNVASSEDWGDVDQPNADPVAKSTQQKGGFNQSRQSSFPTSTTEQTEDWGDDLTSTTTNIPKSTRKLHGNVTSPSNRDTGSFKTNEHSLDGSSSNIKNTKPATGNPQKGFGQANKNPKTIVASGEDWEDDIDTTVTFTSPCQNNTAIEASGGISSEERKDITAAAKSDHFNNYHQDSKSNSSHHMQENDQYNNNKETLSVTVNPSGKRNVQDSGIISLQDSLRKTKVDNIQDDNTIKNANIDEQANVVEDHPVNVDDSHSPCTDNIENKGFGDCEGATANTRQEVKAAKDDCSKTENKADKSKDLADNKHNEEMRIATEEIVQNSDHLHDSDNLKGNANKDAQKVTVVTANMDTKEALCESSDDKLDKRNTSNTNATATSSKIEKVKENTTSTKGKEILQDIDSTTKDTKLKENLPKLDLSKTDDADEPVPDFLKTPQHKNWADYDFDEEELDISQDLIYYQT